MQPLNIFISYRHEDAADGAARLLDQLEAQLGANCKIFIDIRAIPPGLSFDEHVRMALARTDVLLVVIGPRWLDVESEKYRRSVDDPEDYPRAEIVTALQRNIPVIPILLNGAKVPRADQLPADLKELTFRNGREIRHASFPSDVARLAHELRQIPTKSSQPAPKPIVENPPKFNVETNTKTPEFKDSSRWVRALGGLASAAGGIAVAWYLSSYKGQFSWHHLFYGQ